MCTETSIAKSSSSLLSSTHKSYHDKELRNGSWFCGYERNISAAKKPLVQWWQNTALTGTTGVELVGTSGLTGAAKKRSSGTGENETMPLEMRLHATGKQGALGPSRLSWSSVTTVANTRLIILNKFIQYYNIALNIYFPYSLSVCRSLKVIICLRWLLFFPQPHMGIFLSCCSCYNLETIKDNVVQCVGIRQLILNWMIFALPDCPLFVLHLFFSICHVLAVKT